MSSQTQRKGRPPEYGDIVRPLSRSYKGKRLEATTPDSSGRFSIVVA
ncbi:hypothetical protein KFU94_21285 [Chloroflexi bacterium TSY]|nr:hypothetical protein [Chloroflexi bacterium TSY]